MTVTTTQPASTGHGDIIVERSLDWTGPGNLRLEADRDISIEAAVSTGAGGFTAAAGRNLAIGADVTGAGAAAIALTAAGGDLWVGRPSAGDISVTTELGRLAIEAPQGQVAFRRQFTHGAGIQVDSAAGELAIAAGTGILVEGGATDGQWVRIGTETSASAVTLDAPRIDVLRRRRRLRRAGRRRRRRPDAPRRRTSPCATRQGHDGAHRRPRRQRADHRGRPPDLGRRGRSRHRHRRRRRRPPLRRHHRHGAAALQPGRRRRLHPRRRHRRRSGVLLQLHRSPSTCRPPGPAASPRRPGDRGADHHGLAGAGAPRGRGAADRHRHRRRRGGRRRPALRQRRRRRRPLRRQRPLARLHRPLRRRRGHPPRRRRLRPLRPPLRRQPAGVARLRRQPPGLGRAARPDPDRRVLAQDLRPGRHPRLRHERPPPGRQPRHRARQRPRRHQLRRPGACRGAQPCHPGGGDLLQPGLRPEARQRHPHRRPRHRSPSPPTTPRRTLRRRQPRPSPAASPASSSATDAGVLGGALAFATAATAASPVGSYAVTASRPDRPSGNYAIAYVPGTLTVDPAPLTVTALDAARRYGDPDPAFAARYDGFVLGEDAGALDGALALPTAATPASPVGTLRPHPRRPHQRQLRHQLRRRHPHRPARQLPRRRPETSPRPERRRPTPFRRGVPPLTPGDASFRTTVAEAPPALANPFDLTYSLGEIVQLAPPAPRRRRRHPGLRPRRRRPRRGGEPPATATCSGAVGRGDDGCGAADASTESYWSTAAEACAVTARAVALAAAARPRRGDEAHGPVRRGLPAARARHPRRARVPTPSRPPPRRPPPAAATGAAAEPSSCAASSSRAPPPSTAAELAPLWAAAPRPAGLARHAGRPRRAHRRRLPRPRLRALPGACSAEQTIADGGSASR